MIPRLTFLLIAAFWLTMNVLLWRAEYGLHGGEMSVPPELVWRKILTAPDASALTIYQDGQRAGFCEVSTSVERAMATLDDDKLPPEGLIGKSGYKIHLNGNMSFGDFTNRLRFDGTLQFSTTRAWRQLDLKLSTRAAALGIHSVAAEEKVHFKITSEDVNLERTLSFAELQDPGAVLRALSGGFNGGWVDNLALPPAMPPASALAANLHWEAHRDRLTIGHEPISAYRLEMDVLDHPLVIYASSLGEILRIELPGGIVATLDEWNRP